jgi:type III secretory pathway component EscV
MTQRTNAWSGWITFATVMLTMIGAFNVAEGLAALMMTTVSYIDAGRLVVVNLTAWGVLALFSGALLIAIGLGLFARSELARTAAVVLVALHALIQLATLAAFPVWSLLMIALDVLVLFALTVHWSEAKATSGAAAGAKATIEPQPAVDAPASGG